MPKNEREACPKCKLWLSIFEQWDDKGRTLVKYCVGCRKEISREILPDVEEKRER